MDDMNEIARQERDFRKLIYRLLESPSSFGERDALLRVAKLLRMTELPESIPGRPYDLELEKVIRESMSAILDPTSGGPTLGEKMLHPANIAAIAAMSLDPSEGKILEKKEEDIPAPSHKGEYLRYLIYTRDLTLEKFAQRVGELLDEPYKQPRSSAAVWCKDYTQKSELETAFIRVLQNTPQGFSEAELDMLRHLPHPKEKSAHWQYKEHKRREAASNPSGEPQHKGAYLERLAEGREIKPQEFGLRVGEAIGREQPYANPSTIASSWFRYYSTKDDIKAAFASVLELSASEQEKMDSLPMPKRTPQPTKRER